MDLIYSGGVGAPPDPGSVEEILLHACSREDCALWDELCRTPMRDIEIAVRRLQCLGWGFELVTCQ